MHTRIYKVQQNKEVDDASITSISIENSSTAGTVHHFALKRFLLEIETTLTNLPDDSTEVVFEDLSQSEQPENLA